MLMIGTPVTDVPGRVSVPGVPWLTYETVAPRVDRDGLARLNAAHLGLPGERERGVARGEVAVPDQGIGVRPRDDLGRRRCCIELVTMLAAVPAEARPRSSPGRS